MENSRKIKSSNLQVKLKLDRSYSNSDPISPLKVSLSPYLVSLDSVYISVPQLDRQPRICSHLHPSIPVSAGTFYTRLYRPDSQSLGRPHRTSDPCSLRNSCPKRSPQLLSSLLCSRLSAPTLEGRRGTQNNRYCPPLFELANTMLLSHHHPV